jgi:hypothetical protein
MRILLSALVLVSTSALACPELAGRYAACRSTTGNSSGSSDVVVTQATQNGAMNYKIEETDDETHERNQNLIVADGKVYTSNDIDPDTGVAYDTSFSAHCMGQILHISISTSSNGTTLATSDIQVSKSGSRLIQKMRMATEGYSQEETIVCE